MIDKFSAQVQVQMPPLVIDTISKVIAAVPSLYPMPALYHTHCAYIGQLSR